MSEKQKSLLTILVIAIVIVVALYFVGKKAEDKHAENRIIMQDGSVYSKGIITKIFYYKGNSVRVKYYVGSIQYEGSRGWDKNPKHLGKGDSINIRYSKRDPAIFFTELENDF